MKSVKSNVKDKLFVLNLAQPAEFSAAMKEPMMESVKNSIPRKERALSLLI